jgi:CheY-like chemotaxis protein/anti-sigma regulatory factor (Ser/Thr protein kinase)
MAQLTAKSFPAARLLLVEDDIQNVEILMHCLQDQAYDITLAENGKVALSLMAEQSFDVILLDRMMPVMDGMTFLRRIRADPTTREIPVIMQTAATEKHYIEEGIRAGVYYYLTKPFSKQILLAIIKSALDDQRLLVRLVEETDKIADRLREFRRGLIHMQSSYFHFKTPLQVKSIAAVVASCFPKPQEVVMGFTELMLNAVEHGNLGICFEEKRDLLLQDKWDLEIERRLTQPEHMAKNARLYLERREREIEIAIEDEGDGFDFERFRNFSPDRAEATNGRGIHLASRDFDHLAFKGSGNRVECVKRI